MDLQTIISNTVKVQRAEQLRNSPQLMLGEMILKLEAIEDKTKPLFIDIMDKRPKGIASWRGIYAELAIQTEDFGSYNTDEIEKEFSDMTFYKQKKIGKKNPTVEEWIGVLREAIGKTFIGYKGGDFIMGKNTPVYLAEHGNASFKIDDKPIDEKDYNNYKTVHFLNVREEKDRVYLVTGIEAN